MKNPIHNNYFPLSEYQDRVRKVRAAMRRDGLSALLLSTEPNVVYTSGFLNGTWANGFHLGRQFVLIAASDSIEPVLIGPSALQGSFMTSAFSETCAIDEPEGPAGIRKIAALLSDWGAASQRIGIENGPSICPAFLSGFEPALRKALPQAVFCDATSLMASVRMIKSDREIDKIRRAVQITEYALLETFDTCRVGMTEREIAGQIALSMAKQSPDCAVTHPWFIYVHATGKSRISWDGVASDYVVQSHDLLYIDCGFINQGYTADMIRVFRFDNPDPALCRAYEAAQQVSQAMIAALKPGICVMDLMAVYEKSLVSQGLQAQWNAMQAYRFLYAGHGIGLEIHEPPLIGSEADTLLQAGMTLAIEPDVFFNLPLSEQTIALKPEEDVLMTHDGALQLTTSSSDLWHCRRQ